MAQNIYDNEAFFAGYTQLPRSTQGLAGAIEWPTMRRLVGSIKDASVLDLGCGFGWFCRWAVEEGSAGAVRGVDISEKMLARARAWEMSPATAELGSKVTYGQMDLEAAQLPEQEYDLVYSSLTLHYLPRSALENLFVQVHRSLKPHGRFVFSVEHPTMTAPSDAVWKKDEKGEFYWPLNHYIDEGERITSWLGSYEVRKYHHQLETYVNLLLRSGFLLEELKESWDEIGGKTERDKPETGHRPFFLMISARRNT